MTRRSNALIALDTAAQLLAVYAAAKLVPFGFDKLLGTGHSIEGFRQIGEGWGVDPTAFRYFVGVQEVLVSLGLFAAVVAFVSRVPKLAFLGQLGIRLSAPGLVATSIGALATEWLVRPGQQPWLVDLAIRLLVMGVVLTAWTVARFEIPFVRKLRGSPSPAAVTAPA